MNIETGEGFAHLVRLETRDHDDTGGVAAHKLLRHPPNQRRAIYLHEQLVVFPEPARRARRQQYGINRAMIHIGRRH